MRKCFLYSHGGSKNHGCEAIVRGTNKILDIENLSLYSYNPDEDYKYELDKVIKIKNHINNYTKTNLKRILASIMIRLFKNDTYAEKIRYYELIKKCGLNDLGISIGGDNYCYGSFKTYKILNKELNKKGTKTVLWGCSVEPKLINEEMIEDLKRYSLITAREILTFEALKSIGANVKLYPDPAFQLNKIDKELPEGFIDGNIVGINISPMIVKNEQQNGITVKNYELLIKHIIEDTDMNVALIPHVIWENNDDRIPCKDLYDKFKHTGRIVMIDDDNCEVLKGYISRCRMFIGARTHATIAAYSTCVPTLVVGYSVKAKGIAKDIFGTYENYVIPVQTLTKEEDLSLAFDWMHKNENSIRTHLEKFMPSYCEKALEAAKELEVLLK